MKPRLSPVLLALAALPALRAETTYGAGVSIGLAKPVSDIEGGPWFKGRGAWAAGLRLPVRLEPDQALVPRVDLRDLAAGPVNVLSSDRSAHLYTERAKVQLLSVGVDYQYYLHRWDDAGFYFTGGAAYSQARFKDGTPGPGTALPPGAAWAADQTRRAPEWSLGAGYKFNTWAGLEARFTQGIYKDVGISGTALRAPVFSLSLVVEF